MAASDQSSSKKIPQGKITSVKLEEKACDEYKVFVSTRFVILSVVASCLVAFAAGQAARFLILRQSVAAPSSPYTVNTNQWGILPPPVAKDGKVIPNTIYTAKNFDTARTVSSSLLIRKEESQEAAAETCNSENAEECASCRDKSASSIDDINDTEADGEEDDEEHLPAGQHLLVDMKGIDSEFLNSEGRLAHAMVEVVNQASLTLLSYHCHALVPNGVSCVGVLLESHVSFHTWPAAGVIILDLFTCGSNCLLPVVPIIERLFGVPASLKEEPRVSWSHKLRGFRNERGPLQTFDMGNNFLSQMDFEYKAEIYSEESDFQRIDVYDMISGRFNTVDNYKKSLANDGSYYANNADLFSPDRAVFLDGVMQSRSKGERAYHESLVHPGLFAHPNPERVAIVGGGEAATLREVLKHKTVKDAIMIEIDEQMVSASRQHLPEWSDCSDLVGSANWCGDDHRAQMYYDDAIAWFIDRYYDKDNITEELLDVIIIDGLDPHDNVEFAVVLYNNDKYITALYNALSEDGVLVVQIGESPTLEDDAEEIGTYKNRAIMIHNLEKLGCKSITVYGQAHGGYTATWNNLIATKSLKVRTNWYRNEAEVNIEIQRRSVRSKSGSTLFHYFDGATMQFFQVPSKSFAHVYCKRVPTPNSCVELNGYDPLHPNVPISSFEVGVSGAGEHAGRGIFAKVDIPKGSYVSLESAIEQVFFPPTTLRLILDLEMETSSELTPAECYISGYGFQNTHYGDKSTAVDASILTFTNHGCNGTYNTGYNTGGLTEMNADLKKMPAHLGAHEEGEDIYNPVADRNLRLIISGKDTFLRDVKAGEEILVNYLDFIGHQTDWEYDVQMLRDHCSGVGVGDVTKYETGAYGHG